MKASDLVKNLGKKAEETQRQKEYKSASEWPKCSASGCPLWTTIKADKCTCTYHHKKHGREAEAITEAIKEHVAYINKYKLMLHWSVNQWREKEMQIRGWEVLPATEEEMQSPTLYLQRFNKWIETSINNRATEIYQGYA